MNNEQEKQVELNAGLDNAFFSFEPKKRVQLGITNWRAVETEKTFDNKTEIKVEFRADIISVDNEPVHSKLAMVSIRFRKAIMPFIENVDPKTVVKVSVKRLGDGTSTTYDIEEVNGAPAGSSSPFKPVKSDCVVAKTYTQKAWRDLLTAKEKLKERVSLGMVKEEDYDKEWAKIRNEYAENN